MAIVIVTIVRSPTVVEVMDGRDKDNRVVVAHLAVVPRDEANLVPMVSISMASKVTVRRGVPFVPIRDHHYHLEELIAKAGLHPSRVRRDILSPASPVSPLSIPTLTPAPVPPPSIQLPGLHTRISGNIQDSGLLLGFRFRASTRRQTEQG